MLPVKDGVHKGNQGDPFWIPPDSFQCGKEIGCGTFATLCLLKSWQRPTLSCGPERLVVKINRKGSQKDLEKEIRVLKKLNHLQRLSGVFVVPVMAAFSKDGTKSFLFMQRLSFSAFDYIKWRCDPRTCDARMRRFGLDLGTTCLLITQVTYAVAWLHSQGWVHRDLGPKNIMFRRADLSARLVDVATACPEERCKPEAVTTLCVAPPLPIACCADEGWSVGSLGFMLLRPRVIHEFWQRLSAVSCRIKSLYDQAAPLAVRSVQQRFDEALRAPVDKSLLRSRFRTILFSLRRSDPVKTTDAYREMLLHRKVQHRFPEAADSMLRLFSNKGDEI